MRGLALAIAIGVAIGGCRWRGSGSGDDAGARDPEDATGADAPRAARDAGPIEAHFVEVSAELGLAIGDGDEHAPPDCLFDSLTEPADERRGAACDPEHAIGGVAAADVDADGDVDLFFTRLYGRAALYENRGGTFADVTAASGLAIDQPTAGAAFGDVDADGDLDLYVSVIGGTAHLLFLREGDRYVERGVERGAALAGAQPLLGSSVTLADVDGDGDLDLHVGEWRNRREVHDGPSMARLLRNRGPAMPGFFEDATEGAGVSMELAFEGVAARGVYVFGSLASDLDGDGHADLVLAGDFRTARAFWGRGDGAFEERTVAAGLGTESNAMGMTLGDYDADGDLDLYVTSILMPGASESGDRLYRNDGARTFTDVTDAAGVRDAGWGWGTAFFDYDADGDLDLVATNGWTLPDWRADPTRLWRNEGDGAFVEVAAAEGIDDRSQGRGLAVLDLEQDGDLDLVIARYAAPPLVYRNERASTNAWLRVRAPIGSRVHVRQGTRDHLVEIGTTTSYLGQSEPVAYVGLGSEEAPVEVRVVLPTGSEVVRDRVPVRTTLDLRP